MVSKFTYICQPQDQCSSSALATLLLSFKYLSIKKSFVSTQNVLQIWLLPLQPFKIKDLFSCKNLIQLLLLLLQFLFYMIMKMFQWWYVFYIIVIKVWNFIIETKRLIRRNWCMIRTMLCLRNSLRKKIQL